MAMAITSGRAWVCRALALWSRRMVERPPISNGTKKISRPIRL
jgi:hypothetical protein